MPYVEILDSSKLREFADDNFRFDENGGTFSNRVENTVLVTSNFFFLHCVFKRLLLQIRKNQGLFEKVLNMLCYQNVITGENRSISNNYRLKIIQRAFWS